MMLCSDPRTAKYMPGDPEALPRRRRRRKRKKRKGGREEGRFLRSAQNINQLEASQRLLLKKLNWLKRNDGTKASTDFLGILLYLQNSSRKLRLLATSTGNSRGRGSL